MQRLIGHLQEVVAYERWWHMEGLLLLSIALTVTSYRAYTRGVARIFQRGGHRGYSPDHHPGITDYIWFIPLLSPRVSAGSVVLSRHEGPY